MAGRQEELVVVARQDGPLPEFQSRALNALKQGADCDFCGDPCWINRDNLEGIRAKHKTPILCCAQCYLNGTHIKQGYQNERTQ